MKIKLIDLPDWRKEPITKAQKDYIFLLREMSEFDLPEFIGTTKGEACDWINANISDAYEYFDDKEDWYGDWGDE